MTRLLNTGDVVENSTTKISLRAMLEAGAHFGHPKNRWNPKMRPYIFGLRGGVYIIDLQKTQALFQEALEFVLEAASKGKTVMFVGTKRQAQEVVTKQAKRCEMFYVHQRWLGGLLTNWQTVKKSAHRMRDLENVDTDPRFVHLTKKERLSLTKEHAKLDKVLAGIRDMTRRPDILFVVDIRREHIAIAEANKLGIPVIGIIDTNSDPDNIDYPVPANDDAIRSIDLFAGKVADAVIEGRNIWRASRPERAARSTQGRGGAPRRRSNKAEPVAEPAPVEDAATKAPKEESVGGDVASSDSQPTA